MNELKIGYDAKRAFCNNTGLGNYSRFVIEGIARENPQDSLLLYTPKTIGNPRIEPILALPNVEPRFPAGPGFKGSLWRTFGIPNHLRADKVDLYHGLSNELPLTIREAGVPSVLTMHDVIYRRLSGGYSLFDRVADDIKYGKSCRNATHIIAVSECTKRDVVELYGVSQGLPGFLVDGRYGDHRDGRRTEYFVGRCGPEVGFGGRQRVDEGEVAPCERIGAGQRVGQDETAERVSGR